jgi:hypothetical protein
MKRCLGLFVIPVVILIAGCKSGVGAHCQVNDDCQSGLTCNATKGVCESTASSGQIDATVIDTSIDAPVDAAVDAHVDAAID